MHTIAFFLLASVAFEQCLGMRFTPLEIDNHPCTPENLKRSNRYICDSDGNVICQSGWREPLNRDDRDELNPCMQPICEHNHRGCLHGECRAPDYCACEVGWEGANCETCVPLPGCVHGTCETALECKCNEGWSGAYCDVPDCGSCENGRCLTPNDCICFDGWEGENCVDCIAMPGCAHGHCGSHPNTCECEEGYEGHLCDQPVCNPPCVNGICAEAIAPNMSNFCICHTGWKNAACDQCVPYWNCPNKLATACNLPNECHCSGQENDPDGLCDNEFLNGSEEKSLPASIEENGFA